MSTSPSRRELIDQLEELRQKLAEAEETVRAITSGEVDALVVNTQAGQRVFTLEGADSFYRNVVEHVNEGALALSEDGIILYANHRFADMLGTDLQRIAGQSILDLVEAEQRDSLAGMLRRANGRIEVLLRSAKGWVPSYVATAAVQLDAPAVCAVVTDLTEQKRVEEQLRLYRDDLEKLVKVRTRALRKANQDLKAEIKENVRARKAVSAANERLQRQSEELRVQAEELRAQTEELQEEIGRRQVAEAAARESEAKANALIRHAPTGIYEIDFATGRVVSLNDAVCILTGYRREELFELGPMALLDHDGLARFAERIKRHLAGQEITDEPEYRVRKKDGSYILATLNVAFPKDRPNVAFVIGHDVTERTRQEEALRQSERRYRELVETSRSIIMRADKDLNITYMNEFGLEFFGYTADELIGKNVVGKTIPERDEAGRDLASMAREIIRDPERYKTNVHQNMRKNGELVWVSWTNNVTYAPDGQVESILAVGNDIEGMMKAESALQRVNRELRAISECNQLMVRARNETALLEGICRILCESAGYAAAWVGRLEMDGAQRVRPVARAGVDEDYLAATGFTWADNDLGRGPTGVAARTGKTDFCQDFANDPRTGPWRDRALERGYRSSIAIPLRQGDKVEDVLALYSANVNGFTPEEVALLEGLARDISFGVGVLRVREERRRANESLRETRDYLDNLINYANAPIIVWDPDLKITRFNHAFEEITGRSAAEMAGKTVDVLIPAHRRAEAMAQVNRATVKGERWEVVEIPVQHVDGSIRTLLWNSATVFAADSKTPVATIAQGTDITERKRMEQMKDEFIGLVSHELKTPVTVIMGAIDTAMTEGVSEEDAKGLLNDAASSAEELAVIVDNLLELSRAQANRLMLRSEPVDVGEVARAVIDRLKSKSAAHRLVVELPTGIQVMADRVRVERVLHNLVDNGIKYSPKGGDVTVFARKDGHSLVIGVRDHGVGISTENQERLFNPFERLEMTSGISGVGLGLNVCRRLVEAQGGRIWVESEPGKGSVFYFTLPLA